MAGLGDAFPVSPESSPGVGEQNCAMPIDADEVLGAPLSVPEEITWTSRDLLRRGDAARRGGRECAFPEVGDVVLGTRTG
ncbi:hypothetical protein [Microtetraspora malaysiensis]|uniref:Uncharacterized protein n=1 Tax=Microtetraspora malaysiensis TaxID=161358 RepID=A0ABW6T4M1_9ACTN